MLQFYLKEDVDMDKFIWYFSIFVLGSFLGWFLETIWCLIKNRRLESRKGLIYGFYIPIYGIATVIISLVVESFLIKNIALIVLITFLVCFIVEYLSSIFQEKCFGMQSWDYSKMVFNINGRVNVLYLLAWSFLGIVWAKYYGIILHFIFNILIKFKVLNLVFWVYMVYMILNCLISILACTRQKMRMMNKNARNKFELWIDNHYNDEFMKRVYANATFKDVSKIKKKVSGN